MAIISEKEAEDKLESCNNLLNRSADKMLHSASSNGGSNNNGKSKAMSLFGIGKSNSTPAKTILPELKKPEAPALFVNPFIKMGLHPDGRTTAPLVSSHSLPLSNNISPESVALTYNSEAITTDDILDNVDSKLKIETAHNEALGALVDSVKQIRLSLPTLDNPSKLADIAAKMGRIVDSIRQERVSVNKVNKDSNIVIHLYAPEQKQLEEFETIDV